MFVKPMSLLDPIPGDSIIMLSGVGEPSGPIACREFPMNILGEPLYGAIPGTA